MRESSEAVLMVKTRASLFGVAALRLGRTRPLVAALR